MKTVTKVLKYFCIGAISTGCALGARKVLPDVLDFSLGETLGPAPVRLAIGGTVGAGVGCVITGTGVRRAASK